MISIFASDVLDLKKRDIMLGKVSTVKEVHETIKKLQEGIVWVKHSKPEVPVKMKQ